MPNRREWRGGTRGFGRVDRQNYGQKLALVSSGAMASGDEPAREASVRSGFLQRRQRQVWDYRDSVPELGHAITFYENCFSRIRLTIAVEEDDGTKRPAFHEDGTEAVKGAGEALAALRQLRSPIGGQSMLLRAIGGCLAAVGEGHLVGVEDQRMRSGQSWEFLSPSEFFETTTDSSASNGALDPAKRRYQRIRAPGAQPEQLTAASAVVVRLWQPDRQFSMLPWAAPLGMLDIMDELVLLTREVAGAVRSRLAIGGVLLVADDINYGNDDEDDAEPGSDEEDPFTTDLIQYASTSIKDKANASGVLPMVVRVPADRVGDHNPDGKQGFRLLEFSRAWDDKAADKRAECVRRFAQGIDLPVEVVMGHMSTTFANARQISADMYRLYVEPKILIAADGLTTGYLRTVLGKDSPFVIDADPTDLVVQPDQITDWKDGFDRFAVSWASYRNKLGASEDDAPSPEELGLRLLLTRARITEPAAPVLTDVENPGDLAPDTSAVQLPPNEHSIAAAVEITTQNALQRAGARLKAAVQGQRGLASLIATTPDHEVAATLGRATCATLMTEAEMFGREFEALWKWAYDRADRVIADEVRDMAREEASRRLYAPAGR